MNKIKYAPDGSHLACVGIDGTVFFFELAHDRFDWLEPLCMVKVESEINDCSWNINSKKFLAGCKNGRVYEFTIPEKSKIDIKETYLVDVPMRTWKIKMMEFQMKKNQKKDLAELEKIKRMKLRGELPMEDEEEEDEDWDPEPIQTIRYTCDSPDRFIVTSNGLFIGHYYICSFDNERPLKAIDMPKGVPCTYFDYSFSRDFIIAGLRNGSYLIWSAENEKKFMEIKMHDGHRGAITSAKLNPKENYILSVGKDGIFSVQNFNREAAKMYSQALMPGDDVTFVNEMDGFETMETEQPLKAREDESEDITDPEALSIQEQKLRTEEYWRMKKAEERKAEIRNKLTLLREEFEKLQKFNTGEDKWIQLSDKEFNIDPEYFEMVKNNIEDRKETTKKEVAWGIEYRKIAFEKLQSVFFDTLEYNRFTVKAFKSESFVSTFRVKKQSEFIEENVRRFKEMIDKEYQPQSGSDDDIQSEGSSQKDDDLKGDKSPTKAKGGSTQFQNQNQQNKKKKTEAEIKREERTKARKSRKDELEKHEKEEGKRNEEDPEDVKKLNEAKNTFGDYKLKMAPDYIVPEKERVNAEKKRQQMILLENSIFNLKSDFNKKLEELKLIRKTSIIELCKEKNQRLKEINQELGVEEELFLPKIDEILEYPEKHFEVSMEDLIKFNHKKAKENKVVAKSNIFGSKKDTEVVKSSAEIDAEAFEKEYFSSLKSQEVKAVDEKIPVFAERLRRQKSFEADTDLELRKIRQLELEYEKEEIKKVLSEAIESFDAEISDLQKEKYRVESDLKQAEMKLITFYEELIILNGMEVRDQELSRNLAECRKEKGKILKEINEIHKDLKKKNLEIQDIKEKEDELLEKFHTFCPEGSPLYDEILNFYRKIIKVRNPNRGEGGADEDDGDEDDDEVDEDEDEDDNEASYKFNQEEHKIDDIEKLRDERLDLYSKRQEIEADIADLHNRCKKLEFKERTVKDQLEETEDDIQDFQKLKMDKLNQLTVSIVLKISQLQNLERNEEECTKWERYREENGLSLQPK